MDRTWGFWTRDKLDILSEYLPAFTTAAKSARASVYLDLFAGTLESTERGTDRVILGSAPRALDVSPPFARAYFFELPAVASKLRKELELRHPGRADFEVVAGDSNDTVGEVLDDVKRRKLEWGAMFAFIDPYNLGVRWSTLESLARFKSRSKNKVELWILCFSSAIPRVLGGDGEESISADQVTTFFGTEQWTLIKDARDRGELSPAQSREEYVNLYRWRIENVLGYSITHTFEVKNISGSPLYHLILATDNQAGSTIMSDVYRKAARKHEAMRREAFERRRLIREQDQGRASLFSAEELAGIGPTEDATYLHQPPWFPFGSATE